MVRTILIDRRLGIEHPYPNPWGHPPELDVLLEIIDTQRAGLIQLDRISPFDAQTFLIRLPDPMLEHVSRQHELLHVCFAIDRKIYADEETGFQAYLYDLNSEELIIPFSREDSYLVRLIKGPIRMVEMRIRFLAGRETKTQSLFEIQQEIDHALRANTPMTRPTTFEKNGAFRVTATNYLRMCDDVARIDDRNEIRILVHAVMIGRANEADPDAALDELSALSRDYADGKLEAVHEDGVFRITLEERLVIVPPFESASESTASPAEKARHPEVLEAGSVH